jgi:hypothetical protein
MFEKAMKKTKILLKSFVLHQPIIWQVWLSTKFSSAGRRISALRTYVRRLPKFAVLIVYVLATFVFGFIHSKQPVHAAPATITMRGTPTTSGACSPTINKPTGVVTNDVLIASVGGAGNGTLSAPAGWTLIDAGVAAGSASKMSTWYRVVDGTDGASYSFTATSFTSCAGSISAYSNVDVTNVIDNAGAAHSTNTSNTATASTTSITTARTNAMVVASLYANKATAFTCPVWAAITGLTEEVDSCQSAGTTGSSVGSDDGLRGTAGATGSYSSAISGSPSFWIANAVALKPAVIQARSSSTSSNDATASLVLNVPSGTLAGDVMIATVDVENAPALTVPGGWTTIDDTVSTSSNNRGATYYKVAGSSEPANYTWSWTGNQHNAGGIVSFSGVDNTNVIDNSGTAHSTNSAAGTASLACNALTTAATDAMLVCSSMNATSAGTNTLTPPTGMIEQYEVKNPTSTFMLTSANYATQPAAGATGNKTVNFGAGTTREITHMVALSPATPITYISGSNNGNASCGAGGSFSLVLNKPNNAVANDVMIASIASAGAGSVTPPASWTAIDSSSSTNGTNTVGLKTYYHVVSGSDGASYTFTVSGATACVGATADYRGVDTNNVIDNAGAAHSANTGTGVTDTATGVTTVDDGAEIVVSQGSQSSGGSFATISGMNERSDVITGTCATCTVTSIDDMSLSPAGATGNKTSANGGSSLTTAWADHMVALRPLVTINQADYRFAVNADNTDPTYIQDNLTASDDTIRGTALDTFNSNFFAVGDNASNWVIEKRRVADGSLCTSSNCTTTFGTSGRVTEDVASSTTESAYATAVDVSGNAVYLVGYDQVTTNNQWRIEKRALDTGSLVAGFGTSGVIQTNPTATDDKPTTIILDTVNGYLYVGGYDSGNSNGSTRWHLEKYKTSNGAICTAANCGTQFGTNGVYTYTPGNNQNAQISNITIDPTNSYLFLTGFSTAVNNKTQWIVQKIRTDSAAVCTAANCGTQFGTNGIYTSDPTNNDDSIQALQVDSAANAIYLGGYESANGTQWRIEKITLNTGALVSAFGGSGCNANVAGALCADFGAGNDKIVDMNLDGSGGYLYVMGSVDEAGTNSSWRIQKRNRSDGSLVSTFGSSGTVTIDPSTNNDTPSSIVLDINRNLLWVAGGDRSLSTTNMEWYFTQLDLDNGTIWLASADTAAAANTSITFSLRLLLGVSSSNLATGAKNFKLQFSPKSGTCDTSFVGESYADISTSSGEVQYHDNPSISDGASAAAFSGDPTDGSDPTVLQTMEEANNFTSVSTVAVGSDGLWDFTLQDSSAFGAYCFRVVYSDGSLLENYTQVPEITFCKDDPKADNLLRHGTYFCGGVKKGYFWAN